MCKMCMRSLALKDILHTCVQANRCSWRCKHVHLLKRQSNPTEAQYIINNVSSQIQHHEEINYNAGRILLQTFQQMPQ